MQIEAQAALFAQACEISSLAVYGGGGAGGGRVEQIQALAKGSEIVVATPGRLIDFLETKILNLKRVTYLVLDEADRMLDMGFLPYIETIL